MQKNNNLVLIKDSTKRDENVHGTYQSEPVLYLNHEGCKIDENRYVTIDEYTQYGEFYFKIVLHNKDEETIIGKYVKEFKNMRVLYNEDKILVCYANFDKENASYTKVFKVISLYNLKDGVFYALNERDALTLFNPNISCDYLEDPNGSLIDFNLNYKQKTLDKGINRFSYFRD